MTRRGFGDDRFFSMSDAIQPPLAAVPWSRLLREIHSRQVLPIIGTGLVTVAAEDGRHLPFTEWLVPEFARRLGLAHTEGMTLNRAACLHLVRKGKRDDIYEALRELVEEHGDLPIPPGLANLAAVRDFDLFVTSTFDDFLSKALRQARPGWDDRAGRAAFHPNAPIDLPTPLPGTFLYHVLGAWDTYPDFAVWEEDYLEFLCGLLAAPRDTRRNLSRELRNRSLLLIGAPFDNWMVRFFLRVAKEERLSDLRDKRINYFADQPTHFGDPMVFYLEKGTAFPQIVSMDPPAFATELRRRWAERFEARTTLDLLNSIPQDMERGAVFISYSWDDLAVVRPFAAALKQAGIPVWFDAKRLHAGADWRAALKGAIMQKSSIFLSLISKATERDDGRTVHEERRWAAAKQAPGYIFYIQVIIDETESPRLEPEGIDSRHRVTLPGATLTPEFAALLRRYVDQFHQHGHIAQ